MTGSKSREVRRYETLDGLRGVAALAVVVLHGADWFPFTPRFAESAVDLFFLLSGFVIAAAYAARLEKGMSVPRFFAIRLIRLYPLYLAGLLLMVVWLVLSAIKHLSVTPYHLDYWKSVPFALFMLPGIDFEPYRVAYPLNGASWSLFYELCVNLVFAATYRFWTVPLLTAFVGLAGAGILINPISLEGGWSFENFFDGALRVGYFFPCGVLIFKLESHLPRISWVRPWHCIGLFLAIASVDLGALSPAAIVLGYPLVVALALKVEPAGIGALLCRKTGQWSYASYAIHTPAIMIVGLMVSKLPFEINRFVIGAMFLAGLAIFCELLDRFYDLPIRRQLSRRLEAHS